MKIQNISHFNKINIQDNCRYQSINKRNTTYYNNFSVGYYNKYNNKNNISFNGKIFLLNPLNFYMYQLFERSLIISKKRFMPILPELSKYVKEVNIEKNPAWDINNGKRKKYVIYLHGSSQNITNNQNLFKSIFENTKYSILVPEYTGFGKSKAKSISVTEKTFIKDIDNIIKYLRDKKIKDENISVIGHSFGGFIAVKMAQKYPNLGHLYLISSIDSLRHEAINIENRILKKLPPIVGFLFNHFKILRYPLTKLFKTIKIMPQIKIPTDIIHSKNDNFVLPESSRALAKYAGNLSGLHLLPKGGHGIEENKIEKIVELLKNEKYQ